jgi:hypothetical protein
MIVVIHADGTTCEHGMDLDQARSPGPRCRAGLAATVPSGTHRGLVMMFPLPPSPSPLNVTTAT